MDSYAYYNSQPFSAVGFPPTPQNDFDPDSPPNNYATFEQYRAYDGIDGLQTPVSAQHGIIKAQPLDMDQDMNEHSIRGRSSSEEKELTPAQSRRKEQNRQAQRAFRERKEKAFKDLEQKLANIEASSSSILNENEILKRELQKYQTENEILRATTKMNASAIVQAATAAAAANSNAHDDGTDISVGPMQYNPTEFYDNLLATHANKTPSHRIVFSPTTGERLLGAGATWDLIVGHPLYKQGLVDVQEVCDRLKGGARCDGQGPVFEEGAILASILESAASGKDEL